MDDLNVQAGIHYPDEGDWLPPEDMAIDLDGTFGLETAWEIVCTELTKHTAREDISYWRGVAAHLPELPE